MTNRNLLLGRSKPSEKLSREEIVALDRVTAPPALPAKPPKATGKTGGGQQQRMVRRDLLKFRWSFECPVAVSRSPARASPSPGNDWQGAAAAS